MRKISFAEYANARDERMDERWGMAKVLGGSVRDFYNKARSGIAQWWTNITRDADLQNLIDDLVKDSQVIEKTLKEKVDQQTAEMDALGYQVIDSMQPILASLKDILRRAELKVTKAGENLISDENKQIIQSYIEQFDKRIEATQTRVDQLAQTNFKTAFGIDEIRRGVTDLFNQIAQAVEEQKVTGKEKYVAPTRAAVTTPNVGTLGQGTPKNWNTSKKKQNKVG